MKQLSPPSLPVEDAVLLQLDGRIVLVESAQDRRVPPTGMRGTLQVRRDDRAGLQVRVALGFPQMFTTGAHQRTIVLTEEEITRLLASERNGAFELVLSGRLDPAEPSHQE